MVGGLSCEVEYVVMGQSPLVQKLKQMLVNIICFGIIENFTKCSVLLDGLRLKVVCQNTLNISGFFHFVCFLLFFIFLDCLLLCFLLLSILLSCLLACCFLFFILLSPPLDRLLSFIFFSNLLIVSLRTWSA